MPGYVISLSVEEKPYNERVRTVSLTAFTMAKHKAAAVKKVVDRIHSEEPEHPDEPTEILDIKNVHVFELGKFEGDVYLQIDDIERDGVSVYR